MIEEIAACLPDSLRAYGRSVAAGPGGPQARPVAALRERAVFDAVLDAFGASAVETGDKTRHNLDRRALASYWTQYYLAALVTPALTALLRLGRGLPLAFDDLGFEPDLACRPSRFFLPEIATGPEPCLATLVEGHLRPLCALCHAHAGLTPRVFWGNAGVIVDYVAGELGDGTARPCAVRRELAALLGADAPSATSPLADTLRTDGADGLKRRRVCCLRYRLPGVPSCGALCPVDCRKNGSCHGSC